MRWNLPDITIRRLPTVWSASSAGATMVCCKRRQPTCLCPSFLLATRYILNSFGSRRYQYILTQKHRSRSIVSASFTDDHFMLFFLGKININRKKKSLQNASVPILASTLEQRWRICTTGSEPACRQNHKQMLHKCVQHNLAVSPSL